jgi:hypothetical protein
VVTTISNHKLNSDTSLDTYCYQNNNLCYKQTANNNNNAAAALSVEILLQQQHGLVKDPFVEGACSNVLVDGCGITTASFRRRYLLRAVRVPVSDNLLLSEDIFIVLHSVRWWSMLLMKQVKEFRIAGVTPRRGSPSVVSDVSDEEEEDEEWLRIR